MKVQCKLFSLIAIGVFMLSPMRVSAAGEITATPVVVISIPLILSVVGIFVSSAVTSSPPVSEFRSESKLDLDGGLAGGPNYSNLPATLSNRSDLRLKAKP